MSRQLVLLAVLCAAFSGLAQAQDELPDLREVPPQPLSALGVEGVGEGETAPPPGEPEAVADPAPAPEAQSEAGAAADPVVNAIAAEFDTAAGNAAGAQDGGTGEASGSGGMVQEYGLRGMAALFFVLALILVLSYLARRFGQNTPLLAGVRLGTVLGRIHLGPKASLLYVKTGGRVLVLGVTAQQISLVTEFEESAFESAPGPEAAPTPAETVNFVEALRAQTQQLQAPAASAADDDLASLRGDLQRLQRYLREETTEKKG